METGKGVGFSPLNIIPYNLLQYLCYNPAISLLQCCDIFITILLNSSNFPELLSQNVCLSMSTTCCEVKSLYKPLTYEIVKYQGY